MISLQCQKWNDLTPIKKLIPPKMSTNKYKQLNGKKRNKQIAIFTFDKFLKNQTSNKDSFSETEHIKCEQYCL